MVETENRVNVILPKDSILNLPQLDDLSEFLDDNEVYYLGTPKVDTNDPRGPILELTLKSHEAALEAIAKLKDKKISTVVKGQKYEYDVTAELYREE